MKFPTGGKASQWGMKSGRAAFKAAREHAMYQRIMEREYRHGNPADEFALDTRGFGPPFCATCDSDIEDAVLLPSGEFVCPACRTPIAGGLDASSFVDVAAVRAALKRTSRRGNPITGVRMLEAGAGPRGQWRVREEIWEPGFKTDLKGTVPGYHGWRTAADSRTLDEARGMGIRETNPPMLILGNPGLTKEDRAQIRSILAEYGPGHMVDYYLDGEGSRQIAAYLSRVSSGPDSEEREDDVERALDAARRRVNRPTGRYSNPFPESRFYWQYKGKTL